MKTDCCKWLLMLLVGLLCSCEEEFDIELGGDLTDEIVFEGYIDNLDPPYFFRLSHPAPIQCIGYANSVYKNIEDAEIVITDVTAGIRDTLVSPVYGQAYGEFKLFSFYDYHRKEKVTTDCKNLNMGGIYLTTKIYGVEGHVYDLDINYKGKHYTARETMIPGTPITDLKVQKVDLGVKGSSYAPCISFVNRPGEDNYYMLNYNGTSLRKHRYGGFYSITADFSSFFSILSDEHLEVNVEDFVVKEGDVVPYNYPPGMDYLSNDSIYVYMMSLSKQCYDAYDQMVMQIRTDGGAYTPRPTNIKGNISGGVWGCFRVSAITEKGIYVGRKK